MESSSSFRKSLALSSIRLTVFRSLPVESIEIVDILERPVADVGQLEVLRKGERSEVVLKLKGFEILTVRVTLA